MQRKTWTWLLATAVGSLLLACGASATEAEDVVDRVVVKAVDTPVWLGDSVRLSATVTNKSGAVSSRPVVWSSSDPTIASIAANGMLRGLRVGTVWARAFADAPGDSTTVMVAAQKVEGATYALAMVGSAQLPFLLTDYTSPDGYRHRRWIVSDTVRFRSDGTLQYARVDRFAETEPGGSEFVDDLTTSSGGYFEQLDQYVAIAWNYITPPPPGTKRDTLELRSAGLVRNLMTPAPCLACSPGPMLELLYRRR